MALYNFSFPASAAGRSVSVRNSGGTEVATPTAGSPASSNGPVVVTVDLPVGDYVATATNAGIHYSARATGVLDVPATLAARVADHVPNATATSAATVAASVDALRDALIAAGLMAAS